MGLEKKDIEIIQEIVEKAIKGSEERLRGEITGSHKAFKEEIAASSETLHEEMTSVEERLREGIEASAETIRREMGSMEERLLIETAAAEGRMRQQIEELAGMTMREFNRMGSRISELSERLQLVERRIAQLETRFGMMEDDLRLYREKASQVASELETFRSHYEAERRDDHRSNEKLEELLQGISLRVEKLEATVFSK